jgi:hypothetical protein
MISFVQIFGTPCTFKPDKITAPSQGIESGANSFHEASGAWFLSAARLRLSGLSFVVSWITANRSR